MIGHFNDVVSYLGSMAPFAKTFVLWLILLAMSTQSVASVCMLFCEVPNPIAPPTGSSDTHHEHALHHAGGGQHGVGTNASHQSHGHDTGPRSACSGHMACCICLPVAAPSSGLLVLVNGIAEPYAFTPIVPLQLTVDVPDRPPRIALA
jgi:hypothetical protein